MSGQVVDSEHFSYNDDGSLAQTIATTATLNQNGSIQSSGAYTDTYAYDPQGAPLYLLRQQNGTTSAYTYLTDGRGNVAGLADSSGHRVNMDDYNPYGAPVGVGIAETVPQNFRIAGTWGDNELGQNFIANRYEDVSGIFDQPEIAAGARDVGFQNENPLDENAPVGVGGAIGLAGALFSTLEAKGLTSKAGKDNPCTKPFVGFFCNQNLVATFSPPSVTYGDLDSYGRATGVEAVLNYTSPSYKSSPSSAIKKVDSYEKCHLLSASLGGSNTLPQNFVPCEPDVNDPGMTYWERKVSRVIRVEKHTVYYLVVPIYKPRSSSKVPVAIFLLAADADAAANGASASQYVFVNVLIVNIKGHPELPGLPISLFP